MGEIDWYLWRQAHLNWFEAAGIENSLEYLSTFGNLESVTKARSKAKDANTLSSLQKMGIHGFERGAVNQNQDIALVNINPKLALSANTSVKTDLNYKLGRTNVENTELTRTEGNRAGLKWLLTQNDQVRTYVNSIFQELSKTNIIPNTLSTPTKEQIPALTECVYYTNWFKYATIDDTVLKNWLDTNGKTSLSNILPNDNTTLPDRLHSVDQLPNAMLEAELAAVDPDLILVSGSLPWTRFFRRASASLSPVKTENGLSPLSNTTYKVHGRLYRYNSPTGVDANVIPLYHTSSNGYGRNAAKWLPGDNPLTETKKRLSTSLQATL